MHVWLSLLNIPISQVEEKAQMKHLAYVHSSGLNPNGLTSEACQCSELQSSRPRRLSADKLKSSIRWRQLLGLCLLISASSPLTQCHEYSVHGGRKLTYIR